MLLFLNCSCVQMCDFGFVPVYFQHLCPCAHIQPHSPHPPFRSTCSGDGGEPFAASCAALTEHFILLGLLDGTLAFYGADDCQLVSEFEHSQGIVAAYPDAAGTL